MIVVKAVHIENEDLQQLIADEEYDTILRRICPTRPKGECFPSLEMTLRSSSSGITEITKGSNHGGYSSKIFNHRDMFAVKLITSGEDMLPYVLNEINTGVKVKESIAVYPITHLVPLDQCCSQVTVARLKSPATFTFFLRMPYYPIGGLRAFMANSENHHVTQSFVWTWNVIHGLIDGVWVIHNKKYAHRDIKPENILLQSYYEPVIADYGFAKQIAESTDTVLGTPTYIAPEVVGVGSYSLKADIFSLGIVFFELFNVGYFDIKEHGVETIETFCDGERLEKSNVQFNQMAYCLDFKPLIDNMLKKNPDDRYDIIQVQNSFLKITRALLARLTESGKAFFQNLSEEFLVNANNPFRIFLEDFKSESQNKILL